MVKNHNVECPNMLGMLIYIVDKHKINPVTKHVHTSDVDLFGQ